jgi:hypothetical protein
MEASKLKQVLDQHKLWLDGKGGERANLTGAKLYGATLTGADLILAYLTDADLTGADLILAYLTDADLSGADLTDANLYGANLKDAILRGANLWGANLSNAILPDISWIIPGCLVQLNHVKFSFYLEKEGKWESFVQDSLGFFIQDNPAEGTFDMLVEDRIIRNIPNWVKLSGLKQVATV